MNIQQAVQQIREGGFVAVTDDEDRENEADLVIAAQHITPELMAFMIRNTSGIICIAMEEARLKELELNLLRETDNTAHFGTPFTMPVDVKQNTRGGVSAEERVQTVRALIDPDAKPDDFGRPGHVFPLRVHPEGLRGRLGHTEASIDLIRRAKCTPAAVIAELLNEDGSLMRGADLRDFLEKNKIPLVSVRELVEGEKQT
ncbi:MAG: 3,4-dihydroxy-2-butanone-4-phosphate synthase [Candidatus Kerfeldbacteria bacterium]